MTPRQLNFDGELASAPDFSMCASKQPNTDEQVTLTPPAAFSLTVSDKLFVFNKNVDKSCHLKFEILIRYLIFRGQ